jgi:DNA-binding response OmpR family regulator
MDRIKTGKLLLVEDENVLRELVAQFLRGEGFEVVEAGDGREAVDLYAAYGSFDVVLLDLNLPILCGIDVCRRIKIANPLQAVVICSAAILDSDVAVLRSLQVDRFLTKPYLPMDLLAGIKAEMGEPSGICGVRAHAGHGSSQGLHRPTGNAVRGADFGLREPQTLVK